MKTIFKSSLFKGPETISSKSIATENRIFRRPDNLPDWKGLLATEPELWADAKRRTENGPAVLLAPNIGGHGPVVVVESLLAVALTLRGARVHTLLCDAALPACMQAQIGANVVPEALVDRTIRETLCAPCMKRGQNVFSQLDVKHHRLSEFLDEQDRIEARELAFSVNPSEMTQFRWQGLAVGEHALAGALRYFAKGTLNSNDTTEVEVAKRYLEASILSAIATKRLILQEKVQHAAFHHGIYVPQGIVGEVCRAHDVHLANWVVAYRQNTLIFSHGDTYHRTLMNEPTDMWRNMTWSETQQRSIEDYLGSRVHGGRDWIYFHDKPNDDFNSFAKQVGMDPDKPIIGMLTNVFWDAQLHYRQNAFPNMLEWTLDTINYFRGRPDLQLLIRIHPAEIRGAVKSRQLLADEIAKAIPDLPENVFIIGPESDVSTYAAMQKCNAVIIYGTKTGVELTSIGIPVIVAGEAWIRNKGLTTDIKSRNEYLQVLDGLPLQQRLDPLTIENAKKYAFHFFFRRMLPLPFLHPMPKGPNFYIELATLSDLMPGKHEGLDIICDGILNAEHPFVYPAEISGIHDAEINSNA